MNFSTFISFQAGWQGLLLLCLQEIQVQQRWPIGKTPVREKVGLPKKKTGFFGNFFQKGGGGHPNSQKCCKITKSFLACQIHPKVLKHVFHTGGSNIWSILSIKVHLILSLSSSIREKNGLFWEFCPWLRCCQRKRFIYIFTTPGLATFCPMYQFLGFKYRDFFIFIEVHKCLASRRSSEILSEIVKSNFSGAGIFRRPAGGKCDRWLSDKSPSGQPSLEGPLLWQIF